MILVAGIGNIFFGDDGFGSEAARFMKDRIGAPDVDVKDFGIRGLDLAFSLMNAYDAAIIVDAVNRGEAPGTIYVIDPEVKSLNAPASLPFHAMDPEVVLATARAMGADLKNVRIVGCEPERLTDPDDPQQGVMGLSTSVQQALPNALAVVEDLIREFRPTESLI